MMEGKKWTWEPGDILGSQQPQDTENDFDYDDEDEYPDYLDDDGTCEYFELFCASCLRDGNCSYQDGEHKQLLDAMDDDEDEGVDFSYTEQQVVPVQNQPTTEWKWNPPAEPAQQRKYPWDETGWQPE